MKQWTWRQRTGNRIWLGAAVLLCLCFAPQAEAKVKLPALISDGMVLQRGQSLRVWGTADAGETVELRFLKGNGNDLPVAAKGRKASSAFTATADANGHWSISLPALKAGGPYRMLVNEIELNDILIGDVWLCSGQSNMELPVRRVTDMFAEEIATYSNRNIRQFIVPQTYNFHAPQADMPRSSWKALTQENVMSFSALAYFLAKELQQRTGIPVGIINSSWGGTPVESWISEEGLESFPQYINDKRQYEDDAYCRHIKKVEGENFYRWNSALYRGDAGLHESTPWYAAEYDDSQWRTVDMFAADWGNNGLNATGGSHWLRQEVEIPSAWEGRDATLRLGCLVDADSVYVNGQFVGTTGYQYPPRIYRLPAGTLKAGKNQVTIRLISNGGQPSFVPEKPYKIILDSTPSEEADIPQEIGLKREWKYRLGAPMPQVPAMMFFHYKPVGLYNAMIAPLRNYGVKGVVWYQGESNVSRRNEYAALLTAMIADWRKLFDNPELPFCIVELADFLHPDDTGGRKAWAEMRQEQAKAARQNSHTYLIKNSDLGEWNDIHPLDKKTLGKRVAEEIINHANK